MTTSLSRFGEVLRAWRKRRGYSQLDLALEANTTPRYVSFIETGRSRPGRDVVLRIGEALGLPLRDRNALLRAAGLSPAFAERTIDDEALAPIVDVMRRVLESHDPFPGVAFGPGLELLDMNTSFARCFPHMKGRTPRELVELWCTRDPMADDRTHQKTLQQVVTMLRREVLHYPHERLPELLALAEEHQRQAGGPAALDEPDEPVLCAAFVLDGRELKTLATVMRFDKPADVTVAGLRVELIFPANPDTEAFFLNAS